MANIDDFNAKADSIKAIADEDIKYPTQPMDSYLQEAENLFKWSQADALELIRVGITQEKIDDLPIRTGACRETQSVWMQDRYTQKEAQKEWGIKAPEAYDLRNTLLHGFRYAFRADPVLLGRVADIADDTGHADMIQDLNDLAVLGRDNTDLLNSIGLEMDKLSTAAMLSDSMAELLATANSNKLEQNETKILRDKAYTYLKELVDEIRAAGKYVFWKDKKRAKGYTSKFWKKKNSRKTSNKQESAT